LTAEDVTGHDNASQVLESRRRCESAPTSYEGASMEKANIIGVDLAKHVFQVHGACSDGSVAFRKKISRAKLLSFLSSQPKCVLAMEACARAHACGATFKRWATKCA
jgi:hypothetical protein